jgi:hypothetical protein
MDSHCAEVDAEAGRMYIACGYYSQQGEFANGVWVYDYAANDW